MHKIVKLYVININNTDDSIKMAKQLKEVCNFTQMAIFNDSQITQFSIAVLLVKCVLLLSVPLLLPSMGQIIRSLASVCLSVCVSVIAPTVAILNRI